MKSTSDLAAPDAARHVHYWRALFFSAVVLIAVMAWMPGDQLTIGTRWDKLNHALAFAALGFVAWRAYPSQRMRAFWALLGFGLLIELVQGLLPTRSAELADLAADLIGLFLGGLAGRVLTRWV